jgi:hypothetical protein
VPQSDKDAEQSHLKTQSIDITPAKRRGCKPRPDPWPPDVERARWLTRKRTDGPEHAQKRARNRPEQAPKGPKAAHGSNQVLLMLEPCGLSEPELAREHDLSVKKGLPESGMAFLRIVIPLSHFV